MVLAGSILEMLAAELGPKKVRTDDELLDERRHDYWVLSHVDDILGRPAPRPACVVQPRGVDDVVAVVNCCRETNTPLIPFGLGSGVCGGVLTSAESVLLDMSTMDGTCFVDKENLLAQFEAGKNGGVAEREVQAEGLTIGHWPQSIDVSSVGGWVATRAAGQFSTGYGNIEDLVYSLEVVLPDGSVTQLGKAPRAAAGPDLRHLFLGSEGTLGIVTSVTFSLRRAPESSQHTAFFAKTMREGLEAQRAIIQAGWQPVVMRQYDGVEVERMFADTARDNQALFFCVHEGPASKVDAEIKGVTSIAEAQGLEAGPTEVVASWLEHRNHVPEWNAFLENGVVLDTIEISAPWTKIGDIYDGAVASLQEVDGILNASGHSSHVYRSGVNIYFTFAAQPAEREGMADTYRECWRRVMEATVKGGGGIAHHHGIGRLRKDYLVHDLGESGLALLRTVKNALDPTGFMNPGVQVPDPKPGA